MEKQLKILLVENINIIALDLKNIFNKMGHECFIIKNTDDTDKEVKKIKPNFILMDLETEPTKSILDEAENICNKFNIPIIFFTRADPNSYKNHRLQNRCEFLPLPFGYDDIREALKRLLKVPGVST